MDCDQVRTLLEGFDAGELPNAQAKEVAAHLAGCPACEAERTEVAELVADLRHAGEAVRPLQPFTLPGAPAATLRHRRVLVATAALAAAWALLLTAGMFWPSFTERLTFLPVGRELSEAPTPRPAATRGAGAGGHSLADAPPEALAAVTALFGAAAPVPQPASEPSVPSELSRLLPSALRARPDAVSLVAVGPVVSVEEGRVEVMATVDLTPRVQASTPQTRRYRLLVTLRDVQGQWRVTGIETAGE